MNKRYAITIAIVTTLPIMATTTEAVPAFSRQIQSDCRSCHTPDMHGLNAFGRKFKRNAFHMNAPMRQELKRKANNHETASERPE